MSISNEKQALALQLIEELRDEKPKVFGLYCKLIEKYGEVKIRATLSEVKYDYRIGNINNMVKIFLYRIRR